MSKILLAALAVTAACFAVETKFWQHGDRTDFEKGSFTRLSLRSDGRIFLAPEFPEIFDSSTPYLWAIAADSKGNLYTAGGGSGSGSTKLFVIDASGKSRTFAELDGLEIHAIAVDSKDQVYAATDPDGKIYKIGSNGKAQLFYDPHQKYIWAIGFNSKGDLFLTTGDQGEIHRVTPAGTGSVFFKTEETHARSLAIDAQDNLIVGTEPGGLILRVSPAAQGFVLYQAPKREITAVAIAKDGAIYGAGVGNKTPIAAPQPITPAPTPLQITPSSAVTVIAGTNPQRANPPPTLNLGAPSIAGGSEVYRIDPDGAPKKAWSNTQDIVYGISFDAQDRPILGTGNRGKIYRLDSDVMSTALLDASPTQVTGFGRGRKGELYAVTGNIGRVYRIGPALEKQGTFESEALDAGSFTYWGRISYRGSGAISVLTRSGNLNRPENNWSPWAALQPDSHEGSTVCESCGGGRVTSPPARFLQYKIELSASASKPVSDLSYIEIAYLSKNVAPVVDEIEVTPANYKFPTPVLSITPSTNITLPPLGQHRRNSSSSNSELSSSQTLNYAKGSIGARWSATDENGDTLAYKVEIRGAKESTWRLLKDNVKEKYLTWDSTAFPDGEYVIRVTASDAPSNPRNQALEATLESDPFLIDNTPPQILNLAATSTGNKIDVRWIARDARSDIDRAEYSINGGEWLMAQPVTKLSDSPEEEYHLTLDRTTPGEQVIAVRVTDEFDNQAVDKVVVK
jgi:sugar lactone lactonase YvrE